MSLGPTERLLKSYLNCAPNVEECNGHWFLKCESNAVKDSCVEQFLHHEVGHHEVGHHVDIFNHQWSKASIKSTEEFADQYAFERTSMLSICY